MSQEMHMTRVVNDREWMLEILDQEDVGHLALADAGKPYVVPVNYAHLNNRIVIHGSTRGRKVDLIRQNPACSFAVNRHPDRIAYHAERRCHYRYQSVLAFGRAQIVETAKERLRWLATFQDYFARRLGWSIPPELDLDAVKKVGIILITVEQMTGRKEEGQDAKAHLSQPLARPSTTDHANPVFYVSGSFRFKDQMAQTCATLRSRGIACVMSEALEYRGIQGCFEKIDHAQALYVVNPDGYVGRSVAADIGYAFAQGKRILATHPIEDPPLGDIAVSVVAPDLMPPPKEE